MEAEKTMKTTHATDQECRQALAILTRIVSSGHTDDDAMEALEEGFQLIETIDHRAEGG
jgi:hypothetical protein